jgi:hypothetical protein
MMTSRAGATLPRVCSKNSSQGTELQTLFALFTLFTPMHPSAVPAFQSAQQSALEHTKRSPCHYIAFEDAPYNGLYWWTGEKTWFIKVREGTVSGSGLSRLYVWYVYFSHIARKEYDQWHCLSRFSDCLG